MPDYFLLAKKFPLVFSSTSHTSGDTMSAELAQLVEEYNANNAKFESGNAAAGTRARKALMDIKKFCDNRRKEIQESKNAA